MIITPARPPPDTILPLQQHPMFADALARMGRDVCCLTLRDGARRVGYVQLMTRRLGWFGQVSMASRGPIWADDAPPEVQARALERLGRQGVRIVNANGPLRRSVGSGFRQIVTPAHVAELDLRGDFQGRMHPKWRNRLLRAQSGSLTLHHRAFDATAHAWLLNADRAQQKARGYRALPTELTLAFAEANRRQVRVVTAHVGPTVVAAMLFLCHGPVATYHIGWRSLDECANGAHNLILAAAMEKLAQDGHVCLDLGLVDTDTAPGLARFKIGSGATVRPLGGTWLRLPDPTGPLRRLAGLPVPC